MDAGDEFTRCNVYVFWAMPHIDIYWRGYVFFFCYVHWAMAALQYIMLDDGKIRYMHSYVQSVYVQSALADVHTRAFFFKLFMHNVLGHEPLVSMQIIDMDEKTLLSKKQLKEQMWNIFFRIMKKPARNCILFPISSTRILKFLLS